MIKKLPLLFGLLLTFSVFLTCSEVKAQAQVNDLGISFSFVQPTGCSFNASASITVIIHNYGTSAHTTIPVEYRVDSGVWISGPFWVGVLPPGSTSMYTFTQKPNMNTPGTYRLIARLPYPDSNPANDADTIFITNNHMPQGNVSLNFEASGNGSDVMRKVTNANSGIFQSASASSGANSTKGLIMDGVNSSNWVTPGSTTNPWTSNLAHFSAAYICFNPDTGKANDTLRMSFDLKQLYKSNHNNTNFRVTINGQQIGNTFTPPVGGYGGGSAPWSRITLDFSSFIGSPTIEIGLESSVKEGYDNGNGTANLIDNMEVERIAARVGGTGTKENTLQKRLAIFPNPSSGQFQITLPENGTYQLEVTDLTGKVILQQTAKNKQHQVNLSRTPTGIYLLKVSGKEGVAVRKLIVE